MKRLFILLELLLIFGCNDSRVPGAGATGEPSKKLAAKEKNNDTDKERTILRDSTFFKITNDEYTYRNVNYYITDIGLSPYSLGYFLVKETKDIENYRTSEGGLTIITLDILPEIDEGLKKGLKNIRTFKDTCDAVYLYPHFLESKTNGEHGDWNRIKLYKYDSFSKPFLKSDEQYWYFNMNPDNQHISKNCFFITLEKFQSGNVCALKLSDMNGLLQEVIIKGGGKKDTAIEWYEPEVKFISENPFQYPYHAPQSDVCNTISISPKDYSNLRKCITKSRFQLNFFNPNSKKDSLTIPIEDGMFFGKPDKQFDINIFE